MNQTTVTSIYNKEQLKPPRDMTAFDLKVATL